MPRATPPGRGRWHLWRRSWPRGCGDLVTASSFSLTDVLNACASTRRPAVMSVVAVPASLRLCPTDSGAGRRSRMMGAPGGVLATRRLPHSRPAPPRVCDRSCRSPSSRSGPFGLVLPDRAWRARVGARIGHAASGTHRLFLRHAAWAGESGGGTTAATRTMPHGLMFIPGAPSRVLRRIRRVLGAVFRCSTSIP
jgi:hypothetical protein